MRPICVTFDDASPLAPLAWRTEGALERARGLLGRASLADGEGLLIRPCSSIHTLGMRFTIDAAFLGADGRVLKLARCVAPGRLAWGTARSTFLPWDFQVLELPAGALDAAGVAPGRRLVFADR